MTRGPSSTEIFESDVEDLISHTEHEDNEELDEVEAKDDDSEGDKGGEDE